MNQLAVVHIVTNKILFIRTHSCVECMGIKVKVPILTIFYSFNLPSFRMHFSSRIALVYIVSRVSSLLLENLIVTKKLLEQPQMKCTIHYTVFFFVNSKSRYSPFPFTFKCMCIYIDFSFFVQTYKFALYLYET